MSDGLSILVTAYQTHDYVGPMLASIFESFSSFSLKTEVLLGVDACKQTLLSVSQSERPANVRVFWSERNVGTYVLSNALLSHRAYEWAIRLDSDDIILPTMSDYVAGAMKEGTDICRMPWSPLTRLVSSQGKERVKVSSAFGTALFSPSVFSVLGGYEPWRCAGDSNLVHRAKLAGLSVSSPRHYGAAFLYRNRPENLTNDQSTAWCSRERRQNHRITRRTVQAYVKPVVCPLTDLTDLLKQGGPDVVKGVRVDDAESLPARAPRVRVSRRIGPPRQKNISHRACITRRTGRI